jgi:hypothetical protein
MIKWKPVETCDRVIDRALPIKGTPFQTGNPICCQWPKKEETASHTGCDRPSRECRRFQLWANIMNVDQTAKL